MSAVVMFLLLDEYHAKWSRRIDLQSAEEKVHALEHSIRAAKFSNRTRKRPVLTSYDRQMNARYDEDMKDGAKFLPSPSQLLAGAVLVSCSDSVAWGRSFFYLFFR
jgi:5-methylcytosine-specific restriction endonuclease McrA